MENKKSKLDARQVIYELKENPLRKFRTAFALMSVIPLLIFFYFILVKFFSISILIGNMGLILTLTIVVTILGFSLGYSIIYRLLKRLMLYAAKMKESEEFKSTMVANVSHEVRNPLAIVNIALSNLMEGLGGTLNKMQKTVVERCQDTINRLNRLVTQLLDMSKFEVGRFVMKRSLIDLGSLVEEELAKFSPVLKNKNLELKEELPTLSLKIWGDRDKITQAFINLFDNAVKYTPEDGKVIVRVGNTDGDAYIEVEDRGMGIPEDKLEKIFDKFERITQHKEIGTGLGLPIAKDIVERHRGRILVESEVGRGTKFTVLLPKDLRSQKR